MRIYGRVAMMAGTLVLAACGRGAAVDEQLKNDLDAASTPTLELAPKGVGQQVVSGIEQLPQAAPTKVRAPRPQTKVRTRVAEARTPQPQPAPIQTAEVPQPTPEPAAAKPMSRPAVSPPPPGGYKTMAEVLRRAPFPITP